MPAPSPLFPGLPANTSWPSPSLTVTDAPTVDDFRVLFQGLDQFNTPTAGPAKYVPLAVLLRDGADTTIGGLWGGTIYSWLVISMLFVPETLRRRCIGASLIQAAETEARTRGCIGMQVDTFGFQAQPFYESLGFTVFGVQPNFPPGHRCLFLRKPFDDG